jgi:hypothetical protein
LCIDFTDLETMFRFAEACETSGMIPKRVACHPSRTWDWNKGTGITPANTFVAKEVDDE